MTDKALTDADIHQKVNQRYGQIAESGGASCCGTNPSDLGLLDHAKAIGYDEADLATLPEGTNLGLGCGSPTTLTMIQPGQTVVDLGSGAGIDCFLASGKVGCAGKVIGVDMTDAMLEKARQFAGEHNYDNVEFRKGMIEELPIDDASVDLVISNCVINLSPTKSDVFGEIARVLKPGGQAAISDIVLLKPLPDSITQDIEAYIGCIAGAELIGVYLGHAMSSGLNVAKAQRQNYDVMQVLGCSPEAGKLLEKIPADFDATSYVASLDLILIKPQAQPTANDSCCPSGSDCC